MKERRKLHKGDIFQNRYAGHNTFLVYEGQSGQYANVTTLIDLGPKFGWDMRPRAKYYLNDLEYDEEHFPLVGHANFRELNTIVRNFLLDKIPEELREPVKKECEETKELPAPLEGLQEREEDDYVSER